MCILPCMSSVNLSCRNKIYTFLEQSSTQGNGENVITGIQYSKTYLAHFAQAVTLFFAHKNVCPRVPVWHQADSCSDMLERHSKNKLSIPH